MVVDFGGYGCCGFVMWLWGAYILESDGGGEIGEERVKNDGVLKLKKREK